MSEHNEEIIKKYREFINEPFVGDEFKKSRPEVDSYKERLADAAALKQEKVIRRIEDVNENSIEGKLLIKAIKMLSSGGVSEEEIIHRLNGTSVYKEWRSNVG